MKNIVLLLVGFLCLKIVSQERSIIKLIDTQKGLSNGQITSVLQDSIGFIWIGTKAGLNRYDGTSFKIYNKKNSLLKSNDISLLKRDSKNRFWVGTVGKGVFLFNEKKDVFKEFSISLDINTIYEDPKNNIWVGTNDGLFFYDEQQQQFLQYEHQNRSTNFNISSIISFKENTLLLGTKGEGLLLYNTVANTLKKLAPHNNTFQLEYINNLHAFNDDEILIGTNGKGLYKLQKKTTKIDRFYNHKIKAAIIRTIYKDHKNNTWIGTDGQGAFKIVAKTQKEDAKIVHFLKENRNKYSINNNSVNAIFQDNQQNIWIGTAWNGVNIIEQKSEALNFYFSDFYGENPSPVLSVFKDKHHLFLGTDGYGMSIINTDEKAPKSEKIDFFLKNKYVQVIKKSEDNTYWIGTFANGVFKFHLKKGILETLQRNSNNKNTLPYNDVRDIIEEKNGDLWIATWGGGLSNYNKKRKTFTNYFHKKNIENTLSSDDLLDLEKDSINNLWIATWGGGLNYFDKEKKEFTKYTFDKSLEDEASNYIYSLHKDTNKTLWLGTKNGLVKFNIYTKNYEKYTIGFTDNSNAIVSVLIDKKVIWLGTKDGVYSLDKTSKEITKINKIKGEYHINAVYKDSNGDVYFGGKDGFVKLNPKIVIPKKNNTQLTFTDFKIFNKSVSRVANTPLKNNIAFEKKIQLNYSQNVFTFDFSLLQYPFASDTFYQIKMNGFEKEWRTVETAKSATYTNLSPGEYTFNVRNKSIYDTWSKPISIDLTITPPFWKTWWAFGLYAFLTCVSFFFLRKNIIDRTQIKNRLVLEKHKREEQDKLYEIKQRFFSNISHEIRTPLALIMSSVNVLAKEKQIENTKKPISTITNNTKRLINLVNELLNFRKLESDHVELKVQKTNIISFVNELFLAFSQEAIIHKISYNYLHDLEEINVWIDRIQFEKVIFNLLSNAFKFTSKKDQITLSVLKLENQVHIIVKDTGKGISEEILPNIFERFFHGSYKKANKGFGLGLSIAKEIIELHAGNISVESKLNEGATFTVKIPLGKGHFNQNDINEEFYENVVSTTEVKSVDFKEFKNKKILLVEDNKHLRNYLKEFLSKFYKIIEASNGEKGLQKALKYFPDVVISDVMMPKMDGFAFCNALKTDPKISHIPVILLTARALDTDKIEGLTNGADDYLIKPFNEKVLNFKVYALLRNRKLLNEKFSKNSILAPKDVILTPTDQLILEKMIKLLEKNINNSEFSVDELCKVIGMSHSNFYKKIKAITGMTIIGFIRDFRLQRAAQLLRDHKIAVIDVCFMVGYTDRKYFSQEFKKKFNLTPTAFIKQTTNTPLNN